MKNITTALALAFIAVAVPAAAAETIGVSFTSATGGQSAGLYSGIVKLRVEGTGYSQNIRTNDAFYDIGSETLNTGYYALAFGTAPLVPFTPSNNIQNYLVNAVPAYNPAHVYTFLINTGVAVPSTLYFGVTDGQYSDNGGAYRVTINAVPEPSSWAMLIAGFGLVGAAARRRRSVVSA